jgi:ABC-type multidrug transport system ATPase subunit
MTRAGSFLLLLALSSELGESLPPLSEPCSRALKEAAAAAAAPCVSLYKQLLGGDAAALPCVDGGVCLLPTIGLLAGLWGSPPPAPPAVALTPVAETLGDTSQPPAAARWAEGGGVRAMAIWGSMNMSLGPCPLCAITPVQRLPCRMALGTFLGSAGGKASCDRADRSSIVQARDQPEVVCARQQGAFATQAGHFSSRDVTQCRACAVMQCAAGMLCAENTPPAVCLPGSTCGGTLMVKGRDRRRAEAEDANGRVALVPLATARRCVAGWACPGGDALPYRCGVGEHCPEGTARVYRWLAPVAVVSSFLVAVVALRLFAHFRLSCSSCPCLRPREATRCCFRPRGGRPSFTPVRQSWRPVIVLENVTVAAGKDGQDAAGFACERNRLAGVTAVLAPGRLTVILGGSGAGKTTCLRAIMGSVELRRGTVGVGLVRAQPMDEDADAPPLPEPSQIVPSGAKARSLLSWASGYVRQSDASNFSELTVNETLLHSARTRLPTTASSPDVQEGVESLLLELGLAHVAQSRVGDITDRGISGGELRRLLIALELVSDPLFLAADEPTTGLDATGAVSVAHLLRFVARTRAIPVVAVLHSPRREVWDLVDDVILLAAGGVPAYAGPRDGLLPFLVTVPRLPPPPEGACAADYAIDLLQGAAKATSSAATAVSVPDAAATPVTIASSVSPGVADTGAGVGELSPPSSITPVKAEGTPVTLPAALTCSAIVDAWKAQAGQAMSITASEGDKGAEEDGASVLKGLRNARARPGFVYLAAVYAIRAAKCRFRGVSVPVDLATMAIAGAAVGIACMGGPLFLPNPSTQYFDSCPTSTSKICAWAQRWMIGPAAFYTSIVLGTTVVPIAVRIFASEKGAWLDHERGDAALGARATAYFAGKLLPEAPVMLAQSAVFLASMTLLAPWRAPMLGLFSVIVTDVLAITSIGVVLSILMPSPDAALLVGTILCGISVNLCAYRVPPAPRERALTLSLSPSQSEGSSHS